MRCLSCGQDNPPKAGFCAYCGAALEATVQPPSPATSVRCNSCGQENPPEADFCGNCGATLAVAVEPPPRTVVSTFTRLSKPLLFGGLAIIIVVTIGYGVISLLDRSRKTPPPPTPAPSKEIILSVVYVDIDYQGLSTGTKESPFTTIQEGIERSGGIVRVAAGVYHEQVDLKDDIVLLGAGPDKTVIYGNVFARDVIGAKICGFTVTDDDTAGIHCYYSSLTIANNTIINQPHAGIGGHDNSLTIINNVIANNGHNGIGFGENCEATIENNVIVNNKHQGISVHGSSSCFLDYNLIWNNSEGDYSPNLAPGPHDLSADPLFIDMAGGNFQLKAGSPCIDAGDPDLQYNDADGSRNDIGAFGGSAECTVPAITTPTPASPPTRSTPPLLISPVNRAMMDNGRIDQLDDIVWDFDWSACEDATEYHRLSKKFPCDHTHVAQ